MDELKPLVTEVITVVEKIVGTEMFYKVYNVVREQSETVRKKRRTELATEAIVNPEKHAQRKVAKAGSRKRKAEKEKVDFACRVWVCG